MLDINYEELAVKTLIRLIENKRKELPSALTVPEVAIELNTTDWSVYQKLNRGEIPGAQKIQGIGWRVNTDIFLAWRCAPEVKKNISNEMRV